MTLAEGHALIAKIHPHRRAAYAKEIADLLSRCRCGEAVTRAVQERDKKSHQRRAG